ncbi:MAG: hypothetical protein KTU85_10050 [Acidimicrobiia bacterium]|nr:hypothetical protein [Acidimicrobiia bacterium]MCY4457724.1 hypothetical protein [Acidimicrobiaceae bacterium]
MASDPILDKLEAAFLKRRSGLMSTEAGQWALIVQPNDRRRKPVLVGCFDDEQQACDAGFRSTIGRRFLIKEVLETDRVFSVPYAVPADPL